nr:cytochrome b6/f complex subunit VI [Actinostachys digitata]
MITLMSHFILSLSVLILTPSLPLGLSKIRLL